MADCLEVRMNDMKHTVVFRNGQHVAPLGQGTWKMGQVPACRKEEIRALRAGIDLGLSVIDTAEMYNNEELVGEAVKGCRDEVFLISKVLPGNAGYRGTLYACEQSMQKLGTDCLDLYLLPWKGHSPFAATVRAMNELQQAGKIRMWGVSNMDVEDMERFYAIPGGERCAADQVLYNLQDRGIEYDLLPWCINNRIPVIAYSPIGEGRLMNHEGLVGVARRHNATSAQIVLAWVLRNPGVIAIPKAGTVAHVEENYRSLSIDLTEEDLQKLEIVFPAPKRKVPLAGW